MAHATPNADFDASLQKLDSNEVNLISQVMDTEVSNDVPDMDISSAEGFLKDGIEDFTSNMAKCVGSQVEEIMTPIEIRFENLNLSADVKIDKSGKAEIPTLASELFNCVTGCFRRSGSRNVPILRGVNGIIRPKSLTLILGQPGSGKSALMKCIANRFPMTKAMTKTGKVSFNGHTIEEIGNRLPRYLSYVDQIDIHHPVLTVLETFQFAHECMGGKDIEPHILSQLQKLNTENSAKAIETLTAIRKFFPEIISRTLGLDHCKNTIVGNAMLRGVSGGERKRVTTGELLFGRKRVLLLDEISTGLDSAATYDIVKTLKAVTRNLGVTVVISLLQPPPEVYNLFDDILLLDQGEILFHGPRERVLPHFEALGYKCPDRKDVADFLLDIPTPKNVQFQTITPAAWVQLPTTGKDFAARFKDTDIYEETVNELASGYNASDKEFYHQFMSALAQFRQSPIESFITVYKRQNALIFRNKGFVIGRSIMVVICALLYGSTFWDLNPANPQVVIGLLFSSIMFVALGQAPQIPNHILARDVFYKQRDSNFFRASTYTLCAAIGQLPLAIVEAIFLGTLVYWMAGLVSTWYRFLIFLFVLVQLNMVFTMYFFFLASLAPNATAAQPRAMVSIFFFVVFAGFIVSRNLIPDYWIWMYWFSPIAWAIRTLAVNQYSDDEFQTCTFAGVDYCRRFGVTFGDYSLGLYHIHTDPNWIIYGIVYLAGLFFVFLILSTIALENVRHNQPTSVKVPEVDDDANAEKEDRSNSEHNGNELRGENSIQIRPTNIVTPVTLSFVDLWYSVPMPGERHGEIDLLKGVTGYAKPGTMTALMGSSGAGKTTLMDVIAARKTGGKIRGKILLNGYPATTLSLKRSAGYCEQMDIHSKAATVREALTFSAYLRQSDEISSTEKDSCVQECLDLLQMNDIADFIVRGLSTEQLKRLTIGVELAAMPSILFLDEPTSGLDAQAAKVIMTGVRNIARTGRTVVCTIHQPSSDVFSLFDNLLLLKRGGEVAFFGELGVDCENLIQYFEAISGTKKIGCGYNPATWMLEVIGAGVGNTVTRDYAAEYKASSLKRLADEVINQINESASGEVGVGRKGSKGPRPGEIMFKKKRAASLLTQIRMLGLRFARIYWRTPTYNLTRYIIQIFLGIVFGSIYTGVDFSTFSGLNSGVGMIFMSTIFLGIIAQMSSLPIMDAERTVYYKERASETYNSFAYFVVVGLVEAPYVFSSSLFFTSIYFPFVGFMGVARFFWYWFVLGLHILLYVFMGQALTFALPSTAVASIFAALLNTIFMLFCGFNPPASRIPVGYKWIYYISPPSYSLSLLAAGIFADCPTEGASDIACHALTQAPPSLGNITVKQYVENNFEMKLGDRTRNILILIAIAFCLRIIGLLALRYINHQKR